MNEVWKDIAGYEGLYMVSNLGRVKSLPRATTKGQIIKPYISTHNGYCYASLSKNNKRTSKRIHGLVMKAFVGMPENGMVIDHIDGDKTNNRLDNLEYVSLSENMQRAFKLGLEKIEGIKVINLETKEVFDSYSAASASVGGSKGLYVARVCKGERSHYRGSRFAHYDDYLKGCVPEFKGKNIRRPSRSLWR